MDAPAWLTPLFASIDARDTSRFVDFLDDDAVFRFGNAPAVRGKRAIRQAVSEFFNSISSLQHDISLVLTEANTVMCRGQVTYTRHDGKSVELPFANSFVVKGDRIVDYQIYIDMAPLYA